MKASYIKHSTRFLLLIGLSLIVTLSTSRSSRGEQTASDPNPGGNLLAMLPPVFISETDVISPLPRTILFISQGLLIDPALKQRVTMVLKENRVEIVEVGEGNIPALTDVGPHDVVYFTGGTYTLANTSIENGIVSPLPQEVLALLPQDLAAQLSGPVTFNIRGPVNLLHHTVISDIVFNVYGTLVIRDDVRIKDSVFNVIGRNASVKSAGSPNSPWIVGAKHNCTGGARVGLEVKEGSLHLDEAEFKNCGSAGLFVNGAKVFVYIINSTFENNGVGIHFSCMKKGAFGITEEDEGCAASPPDGTLDYNTFLNNKVGVLVNYGLPRIQFSNTFSSGKIGVLNASVTSYAKKKVGRVFVLGNTMGIVPGLDTNPRDPASYLAMEMPGLGGSGKFWDVVLGDPNLPKNYVDLYENGAGPASRPRMVLTGDLKPSPGCSLVP